MHDGKGVDAGLLRSRYRLTKQRAAILRALGNEEHLRAEAIFERVREELPEVSLGTIYRTLDILRDIGLVQSFAFAGQAARFEATLQKHHHLICNRCGDLRNVGADEVLPLAQGIARTHGYAEIDCSFVVTGVCPECAGQSSTLAGANSTSDGISP
jgi:Fe2+ or Zn2+ uptake regulation protein